MMRSRFLGFLVVFCYLANAQAPIDLNVQNWTQILKDEWLVEFYAPWCPACQLLQPEWNRLASVAPDLGIKVAKLDCTVEASVAMIFTITSLPTIYHIKDGVFRLVKGKRMSEELKHFVETQSYELIEPETWPYSPGAFYMPTVVRLLDLGMSVTRFHKYMVSKGMPAALSLLFVATAILGSGACFGMLLLFICEYCCPPRPQILSVFGMAGARPEPIVTKDNDTDQDSVLDDSWTEMMPPNTNETSGSRETETSTVQRHSKKRK
uniref:Thioredoxin-related transmembrane protein 1 n=1 Tax=Schistocephalus solidus TaxID=70667 RepID=A0A0V0JCP1_SCHSO